MMSLLAQAQQGGTPPPLFQFLDQVSAGDFSTNATLGIFKIFLILGLMIYIVFALVIIRQVDMMSKTVETNISPILRLSAILHLVASIFVLFLAVVVL